ncbi:MAG: type IV secretion system DNA-binding domain-containing protein [Gammaproteobacteria bacterium]|nr:type IV secretion system DNA-binding domain-containing protein [Gammaproteobacteria bacterium]
MKTLLRAALHATFFAAGIFGLAALSWTAPTVLSVSAPVLATIFREVPASEPLRALEWIFLATLGVFCITAPVEVAREAQAARDRSRRAQAAAKKAAAEVTDSLRIGPRAEIPDRVFTQHILLIGGTGAGKSQVLRAAALHARKTGAPAIIPAVEDSLFQALYDPDLDTILCPWDVRSVDWSPLAEIQNTDTDPALLASCFIKKAQGESETWASYARTLLAAMLKKTVEAGGSMNALLKIFRDDAALTAVLENMPGESLLREGNERMLGSVVGTADSGAVVLRDVAGDLTADDGWSIRRWTAEQVQRADEGKPGGFLWILLGETVRDKMEPIVTVALAIATRAILSSPERPSRRFYLLVDEIAAFPALPAFPAALARGRKYGLSVWVGLQGISQLRDTYGQHGADSLLSCLSTQVLFRTADAVSSQWASDLIGTRHLTRTSRSSSESSGGGGLMNPQGGSSSTSESESHTIEAAVLPSEVAGLPNLKAYLRIAGDALNVRLVTITYIPIEPIHPALIFDAPVRASKADMPQDHDELSESDAPPESAPNDGFGALEDEDRFILEDSVEARMLAGILAKPGAKLLEQIPTN